MVIDETTSQPSNNCDDVFVYITDTVEPGKAIAINKTYLSNENDRNYAWHICQLKFYCSSFLNVQY